MKKMLSMFSSVLLFASLSYAGTPQEQGAQLSGKFFHSQIFGSTSTATNFPVSVALAPGSTNSGGQTISYQNCFTKFIVQLSSAATFNVFDGATTTAPILSISGNSLGATTAGSQNGNTISLPEDHLGPLCLTPGNTTNLQISTGTVVGVVANMTINYEGYTTAGPGSVSN